jgi:hypothetical protein
MALSPLADGESCETMDLRRSVILAVGGDEKLGDVRRRRRLC